MAIIRIQHSLQGISGLAEDRFVNTWYAIGAVPLVPPAGPNLADHFEEFYGPDGIGPYLSPVANGLGRSIKIYNMDDPIPRVPAYERISTAVPFGNMGVNCLPNEVAMCLSFEAVQESGSPQARRRGRVYLGPLSIAALEATEAPPESRPKDELVALALNAVQTLSASMLADGYNWCVYSPTANDAHAVVRAWIDNAWDTQRRRGNRPTALVSVPIPA